MYKTSIEGIKSKAPGFLLFLVWPFGSLIFAIGNLRKYPVGLFILIGFFYGLTTNFIEGTDMKTYAMEFEQITKWNYTTFINSLTSGKYSDYYTIVFSFLISRLTDNPKIYIGIMLMIYSFFYFNSVFIIIRKIDFTNSKVILILVIICFFYIPLFYANSLRFYTALYVFIFSALQFTFNNNRKSLFFAALSPLIHFSFYIPLILFSIYFFSGKKRNIALAILIATFFTGQFVNFSNFTKNEAGQKKIYAYTSIEGIEGMQGKFESNRTSISFRFQIYQGVIKYHYYIAVFFFILVFLIKENRRIFDNINPQILNLNLILLSSANFTANWFQGERFQNLFITFLLLSTTYAIGKRNEKSKLRPTWILMLATIPFAVSTSYVYFRTISLEFYFTNIFYNLIND